VIACGKTTMTPKRLAKDRLSVKGNTSRAYKAVQIVS
jgi:hypothetical protein